MRNPANAMVATCADSITVQAELVGLLASAARTAANTAVTSTPLASGGSGTSAGISILCSRRNSSSKGALNSASASAFLSS